MGLLSVNAADHHALHALRPGHVDIASGGSARSDHLKGDRPRRV